MVKLHNKFIKTINNYNNLNQRIINTYAVLSMLNM